MKPLPLRLAARIASGSLRVWIIVGILLRLTRLRDRVGGLSLVFYTTPWPVIAAGFVVLALHFARLGSRHRVRRYVILTGGALFTWVALSWRSTPPPQQAPDLRVALWNVARPEGEGRFPRIVRWLKSQEADIIAVAEAEPRGGSIAPQWRAAFPGYQMEELPGDMLCLLRGEVLKREDGLLGPQSFYGLRRVRVRGRELLLLQVDINGNPLRSRREAFVQLSRIVSAHAGEDLVLLGDMNTPRESVHFDPLRKEMTQAFEAAGNGFAETWPIPLPALSLDQVWLGGRLHPLACRIGWPLLSDHRPVMVDVAAR